jgi:hypothetical protein
MAKGPVTISPQSAMVSGLTSAALTVTAAFDGGCITSDAGWCCRLVAIDASVLFRFNGFASPDMTNRVLRPQNA